MDRTARLSLSKPYRTTFFLFFVVYTESAYYDRAIFPVEIYITGLRLISPGEIVQI